MNEAAFLQKTACKNANNIQNVGRELCFPIAGFGYALDSILNNRNRWHSKIVCHIKNSAGLNYYVSTTYAKHYDYLRLIETTTLLKCNKKLTPEIFELYPACNTVVCRYIGKFLSDYLKDNSGEILKAISAVFEYMKEVNRIEQCYKAFTIPPIINISLDLSDKFPKEFNFLPKTKVVLEALEKSGIRFLYGCGVEDPHIWNFRIKKISGKTRALTTDFDYFSNKVNCFWELGYFCATLRWLGKNNFYLKYMVENALFTFVQNIDLKSEFMFWLGILSSYCGYRDSFCNSLATNEMPAPELEEQYKIIKILDKRIYCLTKKILDNQCLYEK